MPSLQNLCITGKLDCVAEGLSGNYDKRHKIFQSAVFLYSVINFTAVFKNLDMHDLDL